MASLVVALACPVVHAQQSRVRKERQTAASGIFLIISSDSSRRYQISKQAERARTEWERGVMRAVPARPAVVVVDALGTERPKNSPPSVCRVLVDPSGGTKIQIDLFDASLFRGEALLRELFRALALAQMYGERAPKPGKPFIPPPDWLVEGLAEGVRIRETGPLEGLQNILLNSTRPPNIEDFLREKPGLMEATSLTIYRAQADALLRALGQLPDRADGFSRYLAGCSRGAHGVKGLLAGFPSLQNDPSAISKIWTLAIAHATSGKQEILLTVVETNRALDAVLDITMKTDPSWQDSPVVRGAAALPYAARGPGGAYTMRQKAAELMRIEAISHPVLRPLVEEYRKLTNLLAAKPKKNVDKELIDLGKIRMLLLQRSNLIADYMNWFEAAKLESPDSDFEENSSSSEALAPLRTDAVTKYLDAIEERGW